MADNLAFKNKLVWFGLDWFSLVWFENDEGETNVLMGGDKTIFTWGETDLHGGTRLPWGESPHPPNWETLVRKVQQI